MRQGRIRLANEVDGNGYRAGSSYRIDHPDYVAVMLQTGYYTLRGGGDEPLRVENPNLEVRRTYGRELLEAYVSEGDMVPVERLGEALRTGDRKRGADGWRPCSTAFPTTTCRTREPTVP